VIVTAVLLVDHCTPELISTGPEIPETDAVAVAVGESPIETVVWLSVILKFVPVWTQTVAEAVALIP
jgi:hypothetical protein